ncbi:MAG TPA: prephenate dehydrogenase/arogenate dehydrogenase family protein [Gemmatimonadales bacterium]|nr:prephenate dehydrogenase/arogenate dehydrogenase family protein [Gemmatimonadales bacterium]
MRPHTLGILGLGAIGGSLALEAKRAGIATVLGWSPEPMERAAAARQGAIDDAPGQPAAVVRAADLLVLAAPPAANLELLEVLQAGLRPGAIVTDVGSVKRAIVARAEALGLGPRFAGGHPLAGTHARGFGAARLGLFAGAAVYVTPAHGGAGAAREVAHFWSDTLGAHPITIDAAQHDRQLAVTSHLPQAVASLLAGHLAQAAPPGATFGPGARDTTRVAASEPALWTEIFLMNRDELLPALRSLEGPLGELERALETGDAAALTAWLARATEWRRRLDA